MYEEILILARSKLPNLVTSVSVHLEFITNKILKAVGFEGQNSCGTKKSLPINLSELKIKCRHHLTAIPKCIPIHKNDTPICTNNQ